MIESNGIGRREFVARVATTAATAACTLGLTEDTFAATKTLDLKTATSATFKSAVGQTFKVGTTNLVLDSISVISDPNSSKRPKGIRKESFSLLFSAPVGTTLAAVITSFTNGSVGTFSAFVTPVRLVNKFSNNSALGQAELFVNSVKTNAGNTQPKAYFEVPFN